MTRCAMRVSWYSPQYRSMCNNMLMWSSSRFPISSVVEESRSEMNWLTFCQRSSFLSSGEMAWWFTIASSSSRKVDGSCCTQSIAVKPNLSLWFSMSLLEAASSLRTQGTDRDRAALISGFVPSVLEHNDGTSASINRLII